MIKKIIFIAWVVLLPFSMANSSDQYQRCAACHLPSGAGVPGAFPPLKNRVAAMAATTLGRQYLVKVINKGLMGPITIGTAHYMGVMPAQGSVYTAEQITELLNYLVQELDQANMTEDWQAFTITEVAALLKQGGSPLSNAQLRKTLLQQQPSLK